MRISAKNATRPALDMLSEYCFSCGQILMFTVDSCFPHSLGSFSKTQQEETRNQSRTQGSWQFFGVSKCLVQYWKECITFFTKSAIKYLLPLLRTNASLFCTDCFFSEEAGD